MLKSNHSVLQHVSLPDTEAWPEKQPMMRCHWWVGGNPKQGAVPMCSTSVSSLLFQGNFTTQALTDAILCLEKLLSVHCSLWLMMFLSFFFVTRAGLYLAKSPEDFFLPFSVSF